MAFKKRYILAEEAEERIVSLFRKERNDAAEIFNTAIDACQAVILDMYDNDAADVRENVRGEYEDDYPIIVEFPSLRCGVCHSLVPKWNYCPNCGARMKGAE